MLNITHSTSHYFDFGFFYYIKFNTVIPYLDNIGYMLSPYRTVLAVGYMLSPYWTAVFCMSVVPFQDKHLQYYRLVTKDWVDVISLQDIDRNVIPLRDSGLSTRMLFPFRAIVCNITGQ